MTPAGFRKTLARIGEASGLSFPVHPHMLRHATGYELANQGVDTRSLQHYLGHKNIQHATRYTELSADRSRISGAIERPSLVGFLHDAGPAGKFPLAGPPAHPLGFRRRLAIGALSLGRSFNRSSSGSFSARSIGRERGSGCLTGVRREPDPARRQPGMACLTTRHLCRWQTPHGS
jgi:hypothetical protein